MNIIHLDADGFFAACEVAKNPSLRGKKVIVGQDRGIVLALTYEAKDVGIRRGMLIHEAKKLAPDAVIFPLDFYSYGLYSKRIFEIVRRFSNNVEEYSIDECFAEINNNIEEIAKIIKTTIWNELSIPVSVGVSQTKVLAKIASKISKPNGLTIIPKDKINFYLSKFSISDIWGIGRQTSKFLKKNYIYTALDYVNQTENWIKHNLSKPYQEIWYELNSKVIFKVDNQIKINYDSISKTRTFYPASDDYNYIFSQLSKNLENACIKARRYNLATNEISFFIKTSDFRYYSSSFKIYKKTNNPTDIIELLEKKLKDLFINNIKYRATGVVLYKLRKNENTQLDLFGDILKIEKIEKVYKAIDELDKKFGRHTVFLAPSIYSLESKKKKNKLEILDIELT